MSPTSSIRIAGAVTSVVTAQVQGGMNGEAWGNYVMKDTARVAFGSCLMQRQAYGNSEEDKLGYRPYTVFKSLLDLKDPDGTSHPPDLFFVIGDAVYMDFPIQAFCGSCGVDVAYTRCNKGGSLKCFQSRGRSGTALYPDVTQPWVEFLQDPHVREFVSTIPTYFTWDDHEFFDNYAEGNSNEYYKFVRDAWHKAVGYLNPAPRVAGELYFVHRVPSDPTLAEFFVLDSRSYRKRTGSDKTMLGEQQERELLEWLKSTPAKWKFIVSSVMFTDYGLNWGKSGHERLAMSDNWSVRNRY